MARVFYGRVFRDLSTFDYQRHFNIDRLLSLEHLSAWRIARHSQSGLAGRRDPGGWRVGSPGNRDSREVAGDRTARAQSET